MNAADKRLEGILASFAQNVVKHKVIMAGLDGGAALPATAVAPPPRMEEDSVPFRAGNMLPPASPLPEPLAPAPKAKAPRKRRAPEVEERLLETAQITTSRGPNKRPVKTVSHTIHPNALRHLTDNVKGAENIADDDSSSDNSDSAPHGGGAAAEEDEEEDDGLSYLSSDAADDDDDEDEDEDEDEEDNTSGGAGDAMEIEQASASAEAEEEEPRATGRRSFHELLDKLRPVQAPYPITIEDELNDERLAQRELVTFMLQAMSKESAAMARVLNQLEYGVPVTDTSAEAQRFVRVWTRFNVIRDHLRGPLA